MSTTHLVLPVAVALTLSLASNAFAIAWGEPDINNDYPNVASVRGIVEATNTARISCSGSLLHSDADKVVILTAAHCTDGWIAALADGMIDTVGVSFEQNNVIGGSFSDGTYYVRGGVPISLPAKDAPFEKLDYGLVVFPTSAVNHLGQTIQARWGTLTPVQVAPGADYLQSLISGIRNRQTLTFTAVGYGTGELFPIPGEETGPANPTGDNLDPFVIRHIADNLAYNAHNSITDVLRLSQNIATDNNGTCSGDSGGPIFYQDQTLGRVQLSLVSGGDVVCRATSTGPAFSRQDALDFIACGKVAGDASAVVACVEDLFGL